MKKKGVLILAVLLIFSFALVSCEKTPKPEKKTMDVEILKQRIKLYAPVNIKADLSKLTARQKKLLGLLAEAGHIADRIFWKQTSPSALPTRDSLKKLSDPKSRVALKFVEINYGPYDRIDGEKRYLGEGPKTRPKGGAYYPLDMSKEEFERYVEARPEKKDELESQYTVVVRDGKDLKAVPFSQAYPEIEDLAKKLEEAAAYADEPAFKTYLLKRANALRTDDYFESDLAWMDVKNGLFDVIIGPIENYEDALFNYKTAFEAVVMIKDLEATKNFEIFKKYVEKFERNLPYSDKKYIREKVGKGAQINFVNVVYMGGDCQAGIKTIACSLPNDPKVREIKGGGKNTMYKNVMEAKFEKIVKPIAEKILVPEQANLADKTSFVNFVTLHEISHTLGRGFVYGKKDLTVRKALKERFSAIEETKADILGMYDLKTLLDAGVLDKNYLKKALPTYLAGLYRSVRFGAEEAHGKSNLIQLNFLRESGAIQLIDGKLKILEDKFFDAAAKLADLVLTTEAEGDYEKAGEIINKYGKYNDEIQKFADSLKDVPRDIDSHYEF